METKIQTFATMPLNQDVSKVKESSFDNLQSKLKELPTKKIKELLQSTFQSELIELEIQAKQIGFDNGMKTAQQESEDSLSIAVSESEALINQLGALLEQFNDAHLTVNLVDEEDCIALVHKCLTLLTIEFLDQDTRVKETLISLSKDYVEENGVELQFNHNDFDLIKKLKLDLKLVPRFTLSENHELSKGSYLIKSKSGTLEFFLDKNVQKITDALFPKSKRNY